MAPVSYRNVFDDKDEFDRLQDLLLGAIHRFSEYRRGNVTFGEIMYVMECVRDSFRAKSEADNKVRIALKGLREAPSVTTLMPITGRTFEMHLN